jgi:hypothetical protein
MGGWVDGWMGGWVDGWMGVFKEWVGLSLKGMGGFKFLRIGWV